jgi:predicted regulator of Ras-like GTPase activity (Roadblock/LC7/MglB family)
MLRRVDAAQALADLTEISSQVVQVVILDRDGSLLATTASGPAPADRFLAVLGRFVEEADGQAQARGLGSFSQLEASTLEGSVFVVRGGGRLIAATTRLDPTVGLVLYDLKRCLESLEAVAAVPAEPPGRPVRRPAAAARTAPRSARPKEDGSA